MQEKSTTLQLPVELTEAQRIEINAKLAQELMSNEAIKKNINECKEAIKTHEGNIALCLIELFNNARLAQVACNWILYPEEVVKSGSPQILDEKNDFEHLEGFTGLKRLIREDTQGIVDELEMDPEDYQTDLDLEDGKAKNKKAKKEKV